MPAQAFARSVITGGRTAYVQGGKKEKARAAFEGDPGRAHLSIRNSAQLLYRFIPLPPRIAVVRPITPVPPAVTLPAIITIPAVVAIVLAPVAVRLALRVVVVDRRA